jgi:hypothetical protein
VQRLLMQKKDHVPPQLGIQVYDCAHDGLYKCVSINRTVNIKCDRISTCNCIIDKINYKDFVEWKENNNSVRVLTAKALGAP